MKTSGIKEKLMTAQLVGMKNPGVQNSHNSVATRNKKYFAYATLLSVYIYNINDLKLINIITDDTFVISTIALSQKDQNFIAIAYKNKTIIIVDILENEKVNYIDTPHNIVSICWIQNDTQLFCFSDYLGYLILIMTWSGHTKKIVGNFENLRIMNIYESEPPVFIGGNSRGVLTRFNYEESKNNEYFGNSRIVAVELDPNCQSNCLVVWMSGEWALFDISKDIDLIYKAENLNIVFADAAWDPVIPGHFYTGDDKNGILRSWNASTDSQLDSMTIYSFGFAFIMYMGKNLLCGFTDGMIGVYSIENKRFVLKNPPGHLNTVFQIQFHPLNPEIVFSSGGEGSICSWNTKTMNQIERFLPENNSLILYSFAISNGGGILVCGYQKGTIAAYSLQSKVCLFTEKLCDHKIINLSFNPVNPQEVLVVSTGDFIGIFNIEKRELSYLSKRTKVTSGLFSPLTGDFAYTCDFCHLIIHDSKTDTDNIYTIPQTYLIKVAWSPIKQNVLATSSNDGTVHVWEIVNDNFRPRVVATNVDKVHAMQFHPFFPNYLIIGSVDMKMRIINISDNYLISQKAHTGKIYSLGLSSINPYLMITSSCDASVKFWSLDRIFYYEQVQHILKLESKWIRPLRGSDALIKLSNRIGEVDDQIIFTPTDIPHINDSIRLAKAITSKKQAVSNKIFDNARQNKAKMLEKAKIQLRIGDIKKYCEILFSIGMYDKAIAAAPAVSVDFWKELVSMRAKISDESNLKANLNLIISNSDETVSELIETNPSLAFIVSVANNQNKFNYEIQQVDRTIHNLKKDKYIYKFKKNKDLEEYYTASCRMRIYLEQGDIYFAAASLLSVGDVLSCLMLLVKYRELTAAYYVNQVTKFNNQYVNALYYQHCFNNGCRRLVEDHIPNEKYYYIFLRKSFEFDPVNLKDRIFYMLDRQKYNDAATLYLKTMKLIMRDNYFDFAAADDLSENLKFIKLKKFKQPLAAEIYGVNLYFAAYKAIWKGYKLIFPLIKKKIKLIIDKFGLGWLRKPAGEIIVSMKIHKNMKYEGRIKEVGSDFLNARPLDKKYLPQNKFGSLIKLRKNTMIMLEKLLMWNDVMPYSPIYEGNDDDFISLF